MNAGTEVTTHFLCRALMERGHHPAVAARSERQQLSADCFHMECGYPVYYARRIADAGNAALAGIRPDAVVCQEPGHWIAAGAFRAFEEIAVLIFQHSMHDGITQVPASIRERALFLANSTRTAKYLEARHAITSVIIPPLFGIDRYATVEPAGQNVLFVSLQLRKGADIALGIARRRPEISFVFVESWTVDPEETRRLRAEVLRTPNITLLANRPDLREVLQATRLLLMPSRGYEGWGRTATEAQICGIPVLGSNRGQLPETVGPGGIALDPDAGIALWLQAFDWMWNDEKFYRKLSRLAKNHATQLVEQTSAVVDRFESCLYSAVDRERLATIRVVVLPKQPRTNPIFARSDIEVVQNLLRLLIASRRQPDTWPEVCRAMARRDIDAAKDGDRSIVERIVRATGTAAGPPAKAVAESARAARHESTLQVLRGLLPGGWHPKIVLEGRDHLDAMLARGKGAVLWVAHFVFAGNVVKMALHGAGYRLASVSRPEHGFSKTRFGMTMLNPIRTSFEKRHLTRRLVYRREQPAAARLAIRDFLAENGVVTLTAGAWEGSRIIEAPFLGGIIRLAAGPVRIARESGAGLLPVFGVKTGTPDEFVVRIGEPIEFPPDADAGEPARVAGRGFLGALAPVVVKYPEQWRGWSSLMDPP